MCVCVCVCVCVYIYIYIYLLKISKNFNRLIDLFHGHLVQQFPYYERHIKPFLKSLLQTNKPVSSQFFFFFFFFFDG